MSNSRVAVAVVDTGIDGSHKDLCVLGGQAFLSDEPQASALVDTVGHGTHVAGEGVKQGAIEGSPGCNLSKKGITQVKEV